MSRITFTAVMAVVIITTMAAAAEQVAAERSPSGRVVKPLPSKINALFIGNSFTFFHGGVNNLASAMVNQLPGYRMTTTASFPGGYTLAQHSDPDDPAGTISKLNSRKWTIVVLQEQSIFAIAQRDAMIEAGCEIHKQILAHSPGTQVVLYETWSRGPWMLEGFGNDSRKQAQMIEHYNEAFGLRTKCSPVLDWLRDGIRGGYAQLKEAIDKQADEYNRDPAHKIKAPQAIIVHAGSYWEMAKQKYPDINLYHKDNYHQSPAGNYLTALIFFKTLTGREKVTGMYRALTSKRVQVNVSPETAARLESIAEQPLGNL